jgi:hypothetical protein
VYHDILLRIINFKICSGENVREWREYEAKKSKKMQNLAQQVTSLDKQLKEANSLYQSYATLLKSGFSNFSSW